MMLRIDDNDQKTKKKEKVLTNSMLYDIKILE